MSFPSLMNRPAVFATSPCLSGIFSGLMLLNVYEIFGGLCYNSCYDEKISITFTEEEIRTNTMLFSQQFQRVSSACILIMLRVAFVITKYDVTCFGTLIGYSAVCIAEIILTQVFMKKKHLESVAIQSSLSSENLLSNQQTPGFFTRTFLQILSYVPLVQKTTIVASLALLIFYQDFLYLSGIAGFALLKCTIQSLSLFSAKVSWCLSTVLVVVTHLIGLLSHPFYILFFLAVRKID